jgi:hypothetical protein
VYLGEQYAVGHQLDDGVVRHLVVEAHFETDRAAQFGLQFKCNACRHGARRDTARLGMADATQHAAPQRETNLGQLRGLARSGLAAHDDHLMVANRARQVLPLAHHGQVCGKLDGGQGIQPRLAALRTY